MWFSQFFQPGETTSVSGWNERKLLVHPAQKSFKTRPSPTPLAQTFLSPPLPFLSAFSPIHPSPSCFVWLSATPRSLLLLLLAAAPFRHARFQFLCLKASPFWLTLSKQSLLCLISVLNLVYGVVMSEVLGLMDFIYSLVKKLS